MSHPVRHPSRSFRPQRLNTVRSIGKVPESTSTIASFDIHIMKISDSRHLQWLCCRWGLGNFHFCCKVPPEIFASIVCRRTVQTWLDRWTEDSNASKWRIHTLESFQCRHICIGRVLYGLKEYHELHSNSAQLFVRFHTDTTEHPLYVLFCIAIGQYYVQISLRAEYRQINSCLHPTRSLIDSTVLVV